jgi:hypothetical protein
MAWLAALLVGRPFRIAAVAACLIAGYGLVRASRYGPSRKPGPLLVAAAAWLVYAGWEWLVVARTPEANIRVDLLVIWPVLAVLSAWALWKSSRRAGSGPTM